MPDPDAEARRKMESETARAFLIAIGGGAVALLALLPAIIEDNVFEPLVL